MWPCPRGPWGHIHMLGSCPPRKGPRGHLAILGTVGDTGDRSLSQGALRNTGGTNDMS